MGIGQTGFMGLALGVSYLVVGRNLWWCRCISQEGKKPPARRRLVLPPADLVLVLALDSRVGFVGDRYEELKRPPGVPRGPCTGNR